MMTAELLTTKEVENLVQLNRVTIYRLIREDGFPAVKLGNQWRFPREEVENWVAQKGRTLNKTNAANMPAPQPIQPLTLFHAPEVQSILTSFSTAIGVSIFIIDPQGNALTNATTCGYPFCQRIQESQHHDSTLCWQNQPQPHTMTPEHQVSQCVSGMSYLRTTIQFTNTPIAYAFMGPINTQTHDEHDIRTQIHAFSQSSGLEAQAILEHIQNVTFFSDSQIQILADLFTQVIESMLQMVATRQRNTRRLQAIANMASETVPQLG